MKEADIILCKMPQSNEMYKKRPAVILKEMPKYGDYLISGITSNLQQHINGFDMLLTYNLTFF